MSASKHPISPWVCVCVFAGYVCVCDPHLPWHRPAVPTLRSATLPVQLLLPGVATSAGRGAADFDPLWHVWAPSAFPVRPACRHPLRCVCYALMCEYLCLWRRQMCFFYTHLLSHNSCIYVGISCKHVVWGHMAQILCHILFITLCVCVCVIFNAHPYAIVFNRVWKRADAFQAFTSVRLHRACRFNMCSYALGERRRDP